MNKNTKVILGIVAFIVIFGVITLAMKDDKMMDKSTDTSDVMQADGIDTETMIKDDEADMMDDSAEKTVEKDMESDMEKPEVSMKGSYEAYSPEKLARAETGDVVLFFHASWCPSCRSLNSDIEANLSAIPLNVSILKADYDKEVELKKKYGVTYQHTLVQVDKDGNMIKKWSGSPKLSNLISQIN